MPQIPAKAGMTIDHNEKKRRGKRHPEYPPKDLLPRRSYFPRVKTRHSSESWNLLEIVK